MLCRHVSARSSNAVHSICCFTASFIFDPFPACEIQCMLCKFTEVSMPCKAHIIVFQLSYSVYEAGMYKTEVISI